LNPLHNPTSLSAFIILSSNTFKVYHVNFGSFFTSHKWEDIKMVLIEIGCDEVAWVKLAQDRFKWTVL
jgi:hypothetical protein